MARACAQGHSASRTDPRPKAFVESAGTFYVPALPAVAVAHSVDP